MNLSRFRILLLLSTLLFVVFTIRGYLSQTSIYLASLGLSVPSSTVVSHQNYPSLTGDEDLLIIQLPPSQVPSLLAQLKTKREFGLSPSGSPMGTMARGLAPTKRFFAAVPKRAQVGGFRVDHTDSNPSWPTFCSFAVDKTSGRFWLYGWSVYN